MTISVLIIDGPLGPPPPSVVAQGAGALCTFEGFVRPTEGAIPIEALNYQAYQPMAQTMLERLANDMKAKHGVMRIFMQHSRGRVAVGQCSFRLVVASRHRQEALAALDEFINCMKRDVPIWKNPVYILLPADR